MGKITIQKARKILPTRLQSLTNEEVASLISQLEILAEIFIETFEEAGSKKQLGVIDSLSGKAENGN